MVDLISLSPILFGDAGDVKVDRQSSYAEGENIVTFSLDEL